MFIPATDDRWAVLTQPPGLRDLGLLDHWELSRDRSRRRRECRGGRSTARLGTLLAAATAGVATVSAGVAAGPAAAATLHKGAHGTSVQALQRALGVTPDGAFGPATKRAVKRFQRAHGLVADGVVGPQTAAALGLSNTAARETSSSGGSDSGSAPATVRLSSAATEELQSAIGVTADGEWGPQSRRALKRWERSQGMVADGKPDQADLDALGIDASATDDSSSSDDGSTAPAPAPAAGVSGAVAAAQSVIGTPYASGGTTTAGFDCSGLTQWAFKKAGIKLPRTSYDQYGVGSAISKSSIQAGDLVFFDTAGSGASHVGVATGPTSMISATSHGVMESSFASGYWKQHYVGARRVS